ncbi:hypothetical protein [Achromobacter sp. GbtcB20]|uniref:hypothetical protein n=1 Tax=Achromobacter sp. GbtcB20 TaxID=2824765 RepID=UPI001C30B927|nr:hypothetical protein [Achromobacter sp. GbtcB20]
MLFAPADHVLEQAHHRRPLGAGEDLPAVEQGLLVDVLANDGIQDARHGNGDPTRIGHLTLHPLRHLLLNFVRLVRIYEFR